MEDMKVTTTGYDFRPAHASALSPCCRINRYHIGPRITWPMAVREESNISVFTVRFDIDNAALVVINPLGAVVVVDADATRPRPSNRLARHAR